MPFHQGLTRAQGDPGFFSFLGKVGGAILKTGLGLAGVNLPQQAPRQPIQPRITLQPFGPPSFQFRAPAAPKAPPAMVVGPDGRLCPVRRRRRIDPLNLKALRRANTRQRAFLRAVDRTLKTMPSRSSVSRRRKAISGVVKS